MTDERALEAGELEQDKHLSAIIAELTRANDVIRLGRANEGQGKITVATAIHRCLAWAKSALCAQPSPSVANAPVSIEAAIRTFMERAGIPSSEFDASFAVKMVTAMMVSFHKYGKVADAYPLKFDAASDIRARLNKYRQTGNKHYLVDAANFAMIEAMHPAPERNAEWGGNDAADSPGRTTASGHRLVQEDNAGNRIMGIET